MDWQELQERLAALLRRKQYQTETPEEYIKKSRMPTSPKMKSSAYHVAPPNLTEEQKQSLMLELLRDPKMGHSL